MMATMSISEVFAVVDDRKEQCKLQVMTTLSVNYVYMHQFMTGRIPPAQGVEGEDHLGH